MQQQAPQPAAPPAAAASVAPPVSAAAAGSSSASHPVDEMTCNFRQYLLRPIMSYGTPAHVPAGGPSPAAAPPQPVSIGLPSVDEIESFDPAAQPELFALYTRIRSHRGLPHTPEIKLEDIAAVWVRGEQRTPRKACQLRFEFQRSSVVCSSCSTTCLRSRLTSTATHGKDHTG
jgi:hypothetical protein